MYLDRVRYNIVGGALKRVAPSSVQPTAMATAHTTSTGPTPRDTNRTSLSFDRVERLFERATKDPGLCPYCFARQRHYHPDDAQREAEELRWGATKQALEAAGHRIREDGSLLVNTATCDVDPRMFLEVVPGTCINGRYHPPRARVVCSCGIVDYSDDDDRPVTVLHDCVDNLAEWYDGLELTEWPDGFDVERAHDVVSLMRRHDALSGQDRMCLVEALRQGLRASLNP